MIAFHSYNMKHTCAVQTEGKDYRERLINDNLNNKKKMFCLFVF